MPFFLSLYAFGPCSQPMLSAKALSFTSRRFDGNAASPFAGLSDDLMT